MHSCVLVVVDSGGDGWLPITVGYTAPGLKIIRNVRILPQGTHILGAPNPEISDDHPSEARVRGFHGGLASFLTIV